MDNEELITFLYESIKVIDFEEHKEEMILLDLEYDKMMKMTHNNIKYYYKTKIFFGN